MNHVIVVGAGATGLGAAVALAERYRVLVIDRTPVTGGSAGWESPVIRRWTERARRIGVEFLLGAMALRWDRSRLLVAHVEGIRWIGGDELFVATGLRPSTASDARLHGHRLAGVVPATVALHLLEAREPLWRRPVLLGDGPWGYDIAAWVHSYNGEVAAVSNEPHGWVDAQYPSADWYEARGTTRIEAVRLHNGDEYADVPCDGLVLSGPAKPVRNIDGALGDSDACVTFVQPIRPWDAEQRVLAGHALAMTWCYEQSVDVPGFRSRSVTHGSRETPA